MKGLTDLGPNIKLPLTIEKEVVGERLDVSRKEDDLRIYLFEAL